jgi:glycosyltransferase involved in cell wall biosynthesis
MSSSSTRKTEPTEVFFLIRSLNPGGAERQLVELAKALHERGHHIEVAVFYGGGAFEDELRRAGVIVHQLGKRGRWHLASFLLNLRRAVRKSGCRTIYSFMGTANVAAAVTKPFLPGVRLVWGIRASDPDMTRYDRVVAWTERLLSRFADAIICNSHAGLAFAASYGLPRHKLNVVHNGIDTERFQPRLDARAVIREAWGIAPDHKLVGCLARLDPMKDHRTFLNAAALVARDRPDARFVCIGPKRDADAGIAELLKLSADLGLEQRLTWAGPRTDVPAVLSALDVLCSTSYGEGFSNSIAEAMACGVPCVVTDVGDSASIVGDTGLVVPPRDPDRMAQALQDQLEQLDLGVSRRVRKRVEENFSLDALVINSLRYL